MISTTHTQSPWPFENLPPELADWLKSEAVERIVEELNTKFNLLDLGRERAIGYTCTWLVLGYIKPTEFIQTLVQEFGIEQKIAIALVKQIKERVFHPVKMGMKNRLHIDIDLLETPPVNPKPKLETPQPAASPQNTVNLKAQGLQAKTIEMEKGFAPPKQPAPIKPATAKPEKPTGPQAKENNPEHPFSLTEQNPNPSGSPNNE